MKKAGWIYCPAPLPEEPAGPLLKKMLVPVPYEAPKKEDPKNVKKTRSGLRRRDTSEIISEDSDPALPLERSRKRRKTNPQ